jgi:hypothetical protein
MRYLIWDPGSVRDPILIFGQGKMNLPRLFIIHAIITFAAGFALIFAPGMIPASVGIHLEPSAYLICYLLGAAELSIGVLSIYGSSLRHSDPLRIVVVTVVFFHVSSAIVEVLALIRGVSPMLLVNIAVRILAVALFVYYGIYKDSAKNQPH